MAKGSFTKEEIGEMGYVASGTYDTKNGGVVYLDIDEVYDSPDSYSGDTLDVSGTIVANKWGDYGDSVYLKNLFNSTNYDVFNIYLRNAFFSKDFTCNNLYVNSINGIYLDFQFDYPYYGTLGYDNMSNAGYPPGSSDCSCGDSIFYILKRNPLIYKRPSDPIDIGIRVILDSSNVVVTEKMIFANNYPEASYSRNGKEVERYGSIYYFLETFAKNGDWLSVDVYSNRKNFYSDRTEITWLGDNFLIKDSGSYYNSKDSWINTYGLWRKGKNVYHKKSGSWNKIY